MKMLVKSLKTQDSNTIEEDVAGHHSRIRLTRRIRKALLLLAEIADEDESRTRKIVWMIQWHARKHNVSSYSTIFQELTAEDEESFTNYTRINTICFSVCSALMPRYTRGFLTRSSRLFGNDPASKHPSPVTLLFSLGFSPSD